MGSSSVRAVHEGPSGLVVIMSWINTVPCLMVSTRLRELFAAARGSEDVVSRNLVLTILLGIAQRCDGSFHLSILHQKVAARTKKVCGGTASSCLESHVGRTALLPLIVLYCSRNAQLALKRAYCGTDSTQGALWGVPSVVMFCRAFKTCFTGRWADTAATVQPNC